MLSVLASWLQKKPRCSHIFHIHLPLAKHVRLYCTDTDLVLQLQAQATPWFSIHAAWQVAPDPYK